MTANDLEEQKIWQRGEYVVGIDEVGTGSLAGDLYVAVVMFPANISFNTLMPGLNDSKQLNENKRKVLYPLIKQYALDYVIEPGSLDEINSLNVYWAKFEAMKRAISKLKIKPNHILIDGDKTIKGIDTDQTAIVKGDTKSISIAAASILAKVDRDNYISELANKVHADYGWASNKAYYCKKHIEALKKHGVTDYHRLEWKIIKDILGERNE